jgi:hypothetical protein
MVKRKLTVLMAALMAVAFSAVAVSSASAVVFTLATTECTGGTNVALCWSEKEEEASPLLELTGEQSETVTGGVVDFTVNVEPVQIILCEKSTGSGTIFQKEPLGTGAKTTLKGTLTYEGCKLDTEPTKKCVVTVNNTTKPLLGTLINGKEIELKPETGSTFIEITYSNNGAEKCPVAFSGTHPVTGTQNVEILNPTKHELTKKGKAVGKTLEFLSSKAELSQELTMSFTGLEDFVDVSTTA